MDSSTIARTWRPAAAKLSQPDAVRICPAGQALPLGVAAAKADAGNSRQSAVAIATPTGGFTRRTLRSGDALEEQVVGAELIDHFISVGLDDLPDVVIAPIRFDEHQLGAMPTQVETTQDIDLEPFDVKGQQVYFAHVRL